MNKVKISVIMSIYKEPISLIRPALDSILNQTFKDFEIIIVIDEPNNFEAIDYLKLESKKHKKMKLIINSKNMGLPFSLNRGIDEAKNSKYIARMDADDVSAPTRLEEQYSYLEKYPDIDLIGCGIYYINKNGKKVGKRNIGPQDTLCFKKAMGIVNIMSHPTFFGKAEVFKSFKYRNLRYTQDYDFVCRVLEKGGKMINLNEYLLYYRKDDRNDMDKKTIQFMTQYYVQYYYSKKELNETEISKVINDFINNEKKFSKTKKAVESYNDSFVKLRKKKIITGSFCMLAAILRSRYCLDRLLKTLRYMLLRKRCLRKDRI